MLYLCKKTIYKLKYCSPKSVRKGARSDGACFNPGTWEAGEVEVAGAVSSL